MGDDIKNPEINSVAFLLGEVRGQLNGISDLIKSSNESTNRRIDDLGQKFEAQTKALNTRIEDHQAQVDERFAATDTKIAAHESRISSLEGSRNKNRVESGIIGAMMSGFVEILKAVIH